MLLSWIKANSNETMTKLYSEYHVDQLTSDDSTSFHYTAVIYLDNESHQFHGGHLQFGDGSIYTPRFYEVESVHTLGDFMNIFIGSTTLTFLQF